MTKIEQEGAIDKILEEIIKCRKELRNVIEASEARLLMKLEAANNKVRDLESENNQLRNKLETLDKQNRKNNLIIFGIRNPRKITIDSITLKLNSLLETHLIANEFNDVYSLGNSESSPIKVELTSYQCKKVILQNCRKLKGTGITIANDLTESQREQGRLLRKFLQKAKQTTTEKCHIKGNLLHIGKQKYSTEELARLDDSEEELIISQQPSTSAPSTPTTLATEEVFSVIPKNIENKSDIKELSSTNAGTPISIKATKMNSFNKVAYLKRITRSKSNK